MNIGRRIYYDKVTGDIIQETGERSGDVIITTIDQDFVFCSKLSERVRETVGCLELEFGDYADDFREGQLIRINTAERIPLFSYPEFNNKPKEIILNRMGSV
ncbi:hypothetical protein [Paenibacillus typhae]|uniref:hypothetical protein n=1 Tax=Paenibacillus typhae TaxID=1174501 RepID=UPI001C8DBCBB|nr:hypothetical protein [Paenibacillus typhae]MBY0014041.1 hypothetical protein [Paenibacillus typhae]